MTRGYKGTAFNKALKSDNKRIRRKQKEAVRKIKETEEDVVMPIRREISNPWDYD